MKQSETVKTGNTPISLDLKDLKTHPNPFDHERIEELRQTSKKKKNKRKHETPPNQLNIREQFAVEKSARTGEDWTTILPRRRANVNPDDLMVNEPAGRRLANIFI